MKATASAVSGNTNSTNAKKMHRLPRIGFPVVGDVVPDTVQFLADLCRGARIRLSIFDANTAKVRGGKLHARLYRDGSWREEKDAVLPGVIDAISIVDDNFDTIEFSRRFEDHGLTVINKLSEKARVSIVDQLASDTELTDVILTGTSEVCSRTPEGFPFEVRMTLEKDGSGLWIIARNMVVVHIGDNDGSMFEIPFEEFIAQAYPHMHQSFIDQLSFLVDVVLQKVESMLNSQINSLNLTMGINASTLFLVNVTLPSDVMSWSHDSLVKRVGYYRWLVTHQDEEKRSLEQGQSDGAVVLEESGEADCFAETDPIDYDYVRRQVTPYQWSCFENRRAKVLETVDGESFYPEMERKSRTERLIDQLTWFSAHGFKFNYTANEYGLDIDGGFRDPGDYIERYEFTAETHRVHHGQMNPARHNLLAINKLVFYSYMDEIMPGYTPKLHFVFKEGRTLAPMNGKPTSMKRALESLPVGCYACKQSSGGKGVGFFKVEKTADEELLLNNGKNTYEELVEACQSGIYLLQDYVVQHEAISAIAPNSVNTIRIATMRYNVNAHVFYALLRLSSKADMGVDNASQGGTFVGIDLETGKLLDEGLYFYEHHHDAEHPVSHVVYSGYQIPYWEQVTAMVKRLHELFPGSIIIGWDVALTEQGPIVLEANTKPCSKMAQMANGGLQKKWEKIRQAY